MPIKDCDRKARANYAKKVKQLNLKLYPTDADILDFFGSTDEPASTISKRLLRAEIERRNADNDDSQK